jgi:hypothetical protein
MPSARRAQRFSEPVRRRGPFGLAHTGPQEGTDLSGRPEAVVRAGEAVHGLERFTHLRRHHAGRKRPEVHEQKHRNVEIGLAVRIRQGQAPEPVSAGEFAQYPEREPPIGGERFRCPPQPLEQSLRVLRQQGSRIPVRHERRGAYMDFSKHAVDLCSDGRGSPSCHRSPLNGRTWPATLGFPVFPGIKGCHDCLPAAAE